MMARLNKAASGQLGGLMTATGLNIPGINLPQPENKPNVMDKLKELKDKLVLLKQIFNNPQLFRFFNLSPFPQGLVGTATAATRTLT